MNDKKDPELRENDYFRHTSPQRRASIFRQYVLKTLVPTRVTRLLDLITGFNLKYGTTLSSSTASQQLGKLCFDDSVVKVRIGYYRLYNRQLDGARKAESRGGKVNAHALLDRLRNRR